MSKGLSDTLESKQITYKVLKNYRCKEIITSEGSVELNNSWIDAILIMLSAVICGSTDYRKEFIKHQLLNKRFIVDKSFGVCSPDEKYRTYEIPGTDSYLEMVYRVDVVKEAIVKLVDMLGKSNKIRFKINSSDVLKEKSYRTEYFVNGDTRVCLGELYRFTDERYKIKYILFGSSEVEVESDVLALYLIMRQVVNIEQLLKLVIEHRIGNTGICLNDEKIKGAVKQPLNSVYSVFTDGNRSDIFNFLSLLGDCGIRVVLRDTENYIKPEWELD